MTVHSMSILVPLIHVVPVGVGNGVAKCIPVRFPMGTLPPNLPCRSTIGAIVGVGANVRGGANLPLRWIGAAGILIFSVYCKPGELNQDGRNHPCEHVLGVQELKFLHLFVRGYENLKRLQMVTSFGEQ
jgi:hypothetical protein